MPTTPEALTVLREQLAGQQRELRRLRALRHHSLRWPRLWAFLCRLEGKTLADVRESLTADIAHCTDNIFHLHRCIQSAEREGQGGEVGRESLNFKPNH